MAFFSDSVVTGTEDQRGVRRLGHLEVVTGDRKNFVLVRSYAGRRSATAPPAPGFAEGEGVMAREHRMQVGHPVTALGRWVWAISNPDVTDASGWKLTRSGTRVFRREGGAGEPGWVVSWAPAGIGLRWWQSGRRARIMPHSIRAIRACAIRSCR